MFTIQYTKDDGGRAVVMAMLRFIITAGVHRPTSGDFQPHNYDVLCDVYLYYSWSASLCKRWFMTTWLWCHVWRFPLLQLECSALQAIIYDHLTMMSCVTFSFITAGVHCPASGDLQPPNYDVLCDVYLYYSWSASPCKRWFITTWLWCHVRRFPLLQLECSALQAMICDHLTMMSCVTFSFITAGVHCPASGDLRPPDYDVFCDVHAQLWWPALQDGRADAMLHKRKSPLLGLYDVSHKK